jgi:hypothetical protein
MVAALIPLVVLDPAQLPLHRKPDKVGELGKGIYNVIVHSSSHSSVEIVSMSVSPSYGLLACLAV